MGWEERIIAAGPDLFGNLYSAYDGIRYQKLMNIPITVDRDAPEVQWLLLRMSTLLKTLLLCAFLCLMRATVNTALGRLNGPEVPFPPVLLAVLLVTLGFYILK